MSNSDTRYNEPPKTNFMVIIGGVLVFLLFVALVAADGNSNNTDLIAPNPGENIILGIDQQLESEMLAAINSERSKLNLNPLRTSVALTIAAERQAVLIDKEETIGGIVRVRREAGYPSNEAASLIISWHNEDVAGTMARIMAVPEHAETITDPRWYTAGIAVIDDERLGQLWVVEFGTASAGANNNDE